MNKTNYSKSNNKINLFLQNAKLLYETFGIIPLLYGSFGLEYLTGENLNSDDIDVLIPEILLKERWNEFCSVMYLNGFILVDIEEHSFEKEGINYSFAKIEELKSFCDISESDIKTVEEHSVKFKLLSLSQYLKVYSTSINDGYRINVRKKKDEEKIIFIKSKLHFKRDKK